MKNLFLLSSLFSYSLAFAANQPSSSFLDRLRADLGFPSHDVATVKKKKIRFHSSAKAHDGLRYESQLFSDYMHDVVNSQYIKKEELLVIKLISQRKVEDLKFLLVKLEDLITRCISSSRGQVPILSQGDRCQACISCAADSVSYLKRHEAYLTGWIARLEAGFSNTPTTTATAATADLSDPSLEEQLAKKIKLTPKKESLKSPSLSTKDLASDDQSLSNRHKPSYSDQKPLTKKELFSAYLDYTFRSSSEGKKRRGPHKSVIQRGDYHSLWYLYRAFITVLSSRKAMPIYEKLVIPCRSGESVIVSADDIPYIQSHCDYLLKRYLLVKKQAKEKKRFQDFLKFEEQVCQQDSTNYF